MIISWLLSDNLNLDVVYILEFASTLMAEVNLMHYNSCFMIYP